MGMLLVSEIHCSRVQEWLVLHKTDKIIKNVKKSKAILNAPENTNRQVEEEHVPPPPLRDEEENCANKMKNYFYTVPFV
jgi:hypothetical protein